MWRVTPLHSNSFLFSFLPRSLAHSLTHRSKLNERVRSLFDIDSRGQISKELISRAEADGAAASSVAVHYVAASAAVSPASTSSTLFSFFSPASPPPPSPSGNEGIDMLSESSVVTVVFANRDKNNRFVESAIGGLFLRSSRCPRCPAISFKSKVHFWSGC